MLASEGEILAVDAFQRDLREIVSKGLYPVEFRAAPIADLLSARIDALDIGGGEAQLTFVSDERFVHGGGVVQGGIIATMLDFSMAVLLLAELKDGMSIGTTNLNVSFMRPAPAGTYTATATVIRRGRSVSFCRADLHCAQGKHVASASATNIIIEMRSS